MFAVKRTVLIAGACCAIAAVSSTATATGASDTQAVPAAARAARAEIPAECLPPDYIAREHMWYMRAMSYLDCVADIVDRHVEGEPAGDGETSDDTVTVSRAELQRIRDLAMYAKDAAARIGR